MRRFIPFILLILPITVFALPALQPVKSIAIKKYMGTWHEIALIPNEYQEGCTNTTVTYSLRSNGDIGMATKCTKNGEVDTRTGKAWPQQSGNYSAWYTRYVWPFTGNYWILYVDNKYQYALAGTSSRNYLWFLSRTKTMPKAVYNKLLSIAKAQHFDGKRIQPSH